jgi:hypothetical protein
MKRRSPLFWLLLVAFAAGSLWWTVHIPYEPARLYRAVPAEATVLSAHHDLAGRWEQVVANPLLLSVATALGADPMDWETWKNDELVRTLIDLLASHEVLLAYVPELRNTGGPGWVFAAWLGGDSQRVRWMLKSLKVDNLRSAASRNGWPVWVWTPRGLKSDQRITLSVIEGMVVGCIAGDTAGIDHVLACADGNAYALADRPHLMMPPPAEYADRGWVRLQQWGRREPEPLHYAFRLLPAGGLEGRIVAPFAPAVTGSVSGVQATEDVAGLLGDLPIACAVVDRSLGRVWLDQVLTNAVGREVRGLLGGESPGTVTVGLLGGDYSGRFMAVRLPSLVGGVTVADPARAVDGMKDVLDRLNATTRWGLVPQLMMAGTQRVYAVEGTGRNVYAKLETKERIAYTAVGGSLVLGSNLETLSRLLVEQQATGARAGGRLAEGVRHMRDRQALAYVWFDLLEGGKVVRLAITAWSLKLLVEDAAKSQAARERLNVAKAWLDALAPFGQLHVWARPTVDATEIDFKVGE